MSVMRGGMRATRQDSGSLSARQRARQAQKDAAERLKRRESALVEVFSAQDEVARAERKLAKAVAELIEFGESKASAAELTGLTAREVGALVRLLEEDGEESGGAGDPTRDNTDREDVSASSVGTV